MRSIKDFDVHDKRVLVRCDFNVPLDETGAIVDDFRIRKTLATIQLLIAEDAKIILMSHLGEPGAVAVEHLKLGKVRERLEELLGLPVMGADDCVGSDVKNQAFGLQRGQILLLENLRFHAEEESNDPAYRGHQNP